MSAVIAARRTTATNDPLGMNSLMLHGQSADGRTNQTTNAAGLDHGSGRSDVGDLLSASSNAVSHMTPTMRYARAAASRSRPSTAMFAMPRMPAR
jgi:hypothetical protein